MPVKSVMLALSLALSVVACSSIQKVVYRIDVPQGNYLQASQIKQLKVGMTQEQILYLLGTPLLSDYFDGNTWYYVFLEKYGYEDPVQHTLTINLDQQGRIAHFELDKPLEQTSAQIENNKEINPQKSNKSWWKFW